MAFPASPSDNQVHTEGNRAFVYDSTLGVWDRVSSTDALSSESGGGSIGTISHGTLEDSVNFPIFSHSIEKVIDYSNDYGISTTTTELLNGVASTVNFTLTKANAKVLFSINMTENVIVDNAAYFKLFMCAKHGKDSLGKGPYGHTESNYIHYYARGANINLMGNGAGGVMQLDNVAGAVWNFSPGAKRTSGTGTWYVNYIGGNGHANYQLSELI